MPYGDKKSYSFFKMKSSPAKLFGIKEKRRRKWEKEDRAAREKEMHRRGHAGAKRYDY